MKSTTLIFAFLVCVLSGCKSKQGVTSVNNAVTEQPVAASKTAGKVSHQYRATGCATVVIVILTGEENPLVLIPKDKLPSTLDVDGIDILFNYHTLRMPQPAGCTKGIPAELTDIAIK